MKSLFATILSIICGFAFSASADTDYRCLSNCVSTKGSSGTCLKDCTYNVDSTPKDIAAQRKKLAKDPHNQFSKHFVSDQILLTKRPITTTSTPSQNYQCTTQCLQSGMQYQYCQQGCLPHQ